MREIKLDVIDSTNTLAKRLVEEKVWDGKEPLLITAEEQTAGRGRTGKSFASARGQGLYMTLVFSTDRRPEECLFLTAAAAVATCGCLREAGCPEVKIKWVNDLYLGERKVCGILTEALTDPDTGRMRAGIVGIGINLNTPIEIFPEELRKKAGAVTGLRISKDQLARTIAVRLLQMMEKLFRNPEEKTALFRIYKAWSMILGREVYWTEMGRETTGIAVDIDEQARLVVDTDQGRRVLDSGYISVRFT